MGCKFEHQLLAVEQVLPIFHFAYLFDCAYINRGANLNINPLASDVQVQSKFYLFSSLPIDIGCLIAHISTEGRDDHGVSN